MRTIQIAHTIKLTVNVYNTSDGPVALPTLKHVSGEGPISDSELEALHNAVDAIRTTGRKPTGFKG
jgi:hypothetical protein